MKVKTITAEYFTLPTTADYEATLKKFKGHYNKKKINTKHGNVKGK